MFLMYYFNSLSNTFFVALRLSSDVGLQYTFIVISTPECPNIELTVLTSTPFVIIIEANVCRNP